ncbi:MAG TPA: ribonuclease HI family protein [Candidatus Paceibacterota bacterium]
MTVTVFTDGGARGNPGPAGAGAVVLDAKGQVVARVSQFLGHQTNNWAEYEAVALGLVAIKKQFGAKTKTMTIVVKLDSELVTRQLSGSYQIKEKTLFPQYIKIHNMIVKDFPHITFVHVRREFNKDADRLANNAMDKGR